MKQFNLEKKIFDDIEHGLNGDGWYLIDNQTDVDGISASITGDGDVWSENGNLHYSGRRPSDNHKWDNQNKEWVKMTKAETQEKLTALFAQQKEGLLNKLADKADQLKNGILAGYPQTEIESFYRQEKEALAWQADHNTPTPMLSQIARVRGVPLDMLISKVIEKSDQFAVAIGIIIGKKQQFEDRLLALKTPEDLAALEQEIEQWQFQVN
nr:MAG TPA: hypothetical protein [Caudoviricetes sp.]